jgi:tetratricopeptide (TPR) repeat protein
MGEDRFLDAADNTKMIRDKTTRRMAIPQIAFFGLWLFLMFSGCTLPRIHVFEDPLSPEEHLNLGVAYERKNEFDSAIKEYKLAAKKLPVAYLYLGNAHFPKSEFGEAEAYYKKAIKKVPDNADAHNNLAWLYYTRGENLEEAETLALKAIELDPLRTHIFEDTLEKIRERKTSLP